MKCYHGITALQHLVDPRHMASLKEPFIHYLQHEVATVKDIEDVKVKDLGYIVNTESGVGAQAGLCGQRMLLRNVGGLFVAGPSGLVSTRSRRCRRWVL